MNYLYLNKKLAYWQPSFRRVDRKVLSMKNKASEELLDLLQDLRKYK